MSFKKSLLAAALSTALPAFAGTYVLIVPIEKYSLSPLAKITVSLEKAALPNAQVREPYSFDFNPLVRIQGDQELAPSLLTWRIEGLPAGMRFDAGVLTGSPVAVGQHELSIRAVYKTKTGAQTYLFPVNLSVALGAHNFPEGLVGLPYPAQDLKTALTFSSSGISAADATWSVVGGRLPDGLALNATTGVISGIPTQAFDGPVTIQATVAGVNGVQVYQVLTREIKVVLAAAVLPKAYHELPYSYDVRQNLSVTGDPAFSDAGVTLTALDSTGWTQLSPAGVLSGTAPIAATDLVVSVKAAYRGIEDFQSYTVPVGRSIKNYGTYRAWSDGTQASSCQEYLQPDASKNAAYVGATGNGLYRLNVGGVVFDAQCDMTTDGGGWTLVFNHAGQAASAAYTGAGTSCDARTGSTCFAHGYDKVVFTNGFRIDGAFDNQAITGDDKIHVQYSVNTPANFAGRTTRQLLTGAMGDFVVANPAFAWRTFGSGASLLAGDLASVLTNQYNTVFRDFLPSVQHLIAADPNRTATWSNSCGLMMLTDAGNCTSIRHWPTNIRFWVR